MGNSKKNSFNVVSIAKSKGKEDETFFGKQIEHIIEVTLKAMLNPNVVRSKKMKLKWKYHQSSWARWGRKNNKKFFFIDLDIITIVAKDPVPMEDELQTFNKDWNHPNPESWKIARDLEKNSKIWKNNSMEKAT